MSLNREQRRSLKKKIAPLARIIAQMERDLKTLPPTEREAVEGEIGKIMDSLTLMEMMAIEDYISSKHLLDN